MPQNRAKAYPNLDPDPLASQLRTPGPPPPQQRRHRCLAPPAEAFAEFDAALALDPRNGTFYADAAWAALATGDLARAKAYASAATALYPRFGRPLAQLGYLALVEGRWDEAFRILQAAYNGQWPDHVEEATSCLANLGTVHFHRHEYAAAVTLFRAALDRDPRPPDLRFNLARALELLDRREEAVAEYRRVLSCCPENAPAREAAARLGVHP